MKGKKLLNKLVIMALVGTISLGVQAEAATKKAQPEGDFLSKIKATLQEQSQGTVELKIPDIDENNANMIRGMRYSNGTDKVRLVFDLNPSTKYTVHPITNGQLEIDFDQPFSQNQALNISIGDANVPKVQIINESKSSKVLVSIVGTTALKHGELNNPHRLFIDINKDYEYSVTKEIEPGLTQINVYTRHNGISQAGHMLEVDLKKFKLTPVLGGGNVLGKNTVANMAKYAGAIAAENASYFGGKKDVYGVTKIAGDIVSSMYLPRTAFGILADGKPYVGEVTYHGTVSTRLGDLPVAGLNATRNKNGITLYNHYYGFTTENSPSATEYVVQNGEITAINPGGHSVLTNDNMVVSATGAAKAQFEPLVVGDKMNISQVLNSPWDTAINVLGVGPRLLNNGQVDITTAREQIGGDVSYGRSPRTGVGILKNGNVLLAVVDGRQAQAKGMTLTEFAKLLKNMTVVDAVNFDGGGSSDMVVQGKTINSPSDGDNRYVATSLAVIRR